MVGHGADMDSYVTMTGNVGSEMELRTSKTGAVWVTFRLACTPRLKRAGEWTDDGTIWITVQCWRGLAENVSRSLVKGDPVVVTGKLRLDSWVSNTGELREQKVIEATSVGHDLSHGTATFRRRRRETLASTDTSVPPKGPEYPANTDAEGDEAPELEVAV